MVAFRQRDNAFQRLGGVPGHALPIHRQHHHARDGGGALVAIGKRVIACDRVHQRGGFVGQSRVSVRAKSRTRWALC